MSISGNLSEINRLIEAFEIEAAKFHDLQFHTLYFNQAGSSIQRKFHDHNHAIMLWQYYGALKNDDGVEHLVTNVAASDRQWGLKGAAISLFGVIEGDPCKLFVRMAMRAGSIFDSDESTLIRSRVVSDIISAEQSENSSAKPTAVTNDNPLAIWLNYLLYHLSLTCPGRERANKIEPDPFSLSLLALERLAIDQALGRADRSTRKLADLRFKVAMSFPGEKRRYVSRVVEALRSPLGEDSVFYDYDYQAQLARPNLDTLLQRIYRDQTDLIVVFICAEYAQKEWCGLEWRVVREIIKQKQDERVMFVRFDNATVDGIFSIDGYIDGSAFTTKQVAEFIVSRHSEDRKSVV